MSDESFDTYIRVGDERVNVNTAPTELLQEIREQFTGYIASPNTWETEREEMVEAIADIDFELAAR